MANIPLKTIKFPGLDDTYTVPQVDNTLSVTGAAADAKKTGDELTELNERLSVNTVTLEQALYKTEVTRGTNAQESGPIIPFRIKNGDKVTVTNKDKTTFNSHVHLRVYDEDLNYIEYWTISSAYGASRTFTYSFRECYYIGITTVTPGTDTDYIVVNHDNDYNVEQVIENAQNDISQLQTKVQVIENDLYEKTIILTDNSKHAFPISNGTTIIITTEDGSTLPSGNPYFRIYNSEKTYIDQFLCSSAYGTARTVTITYDDIAYVGMYATPSKAIKVYIPDNTKLVPKVEEIANIVGQNVIIVDASGNGDYTSLTEALYENVENGIDIEVKPGTYNIVSEYVALFGQEAVDSMADADSATFNGFQYGAIIRNRTIKFDSGAYVVCDWTGHTVNGTHRFSALRVDYNCKIIGLHLVSTATFYAIHDDYGLSVPYTVEYKNCYVEGVNLRNADCIGGGCKKYSRHIIKNCYFNNHLTDSATVRYHNTNAEGAVPEIYVSNCYFNNWFTPRWYGTQTSKMKVYVNNCEARAIYKVAESSSFNVDNVELYKWCNTETNPVT